MGLGGQPSGPAGLCWSQVVISASAPLWEWVPPPTPLVWSRVWPGSSPWPPAYHCCSFSTPISASALPPSLSLPLGPGRLTHTDGTTRTALLPGPAAPHWQALPRGGSMRSGCFSQALSLLRSGTSGDTCVPLVSHLPPRGPGPTEPRHNLPPLVAATAWVITASCPRLTSAHLAALVRSPLPATSLRGPEARHENLSCWTT